MVVRRTFKETKAQAAERAASGVAGEVSFDEAARRKEFALASLREHELAVKRGEFVPREDIRVALGTLVGRFRSRMLAIPTRAAPLLAAETSLEGYRSVLVRLINEGLKELSETAIHSFEYGVSRARAGATNGPAADAEDFGLGG